MKEIDELRRLMKALDMSAENQENLFDRVEILEKKVESLGRMMDDIHKILELHTEKLKHINLN